MKKVSIVGTTSWGTTLAMVLAHNGLHVVLLARTSDEAILLERDKENKRMLPGYYFPENILVTASKDEALADSSMVVVAVPSKSLRDNVRSLSNHVASDSMIVSATKGLEKGSAKRMSQIMEEELSEDLHAKICVLSGPNLANEIASGKPASTVIASEDEEVAIQAQNLFMSTNFRVYTSDDLVGVELGGSLKNIIALGAGISDGLSYGDNGKAAFITRGLVEITRLGVAAGAQPMTFAGLAGLGDLIATCGSPLSRNRYVGEQLAYGRHLDQVLSSMGSVAEGVDTTAAAMLLAANLGVDMPLIDAIHRVLFDGLDPRKVVGELMTRAPSTEWRGIKDLQ